MDTEYTNEQLKVRAAKCLAVLQSGTLSLDAECKGKVTSCTKEEGLVEMDFALTKNMQNPAGILHGAVTAWLCDLCMAEALCTYEGCIHGTTIDMNVSYIAPIPAGATLHVKAYCIKLGGFVRRARAEIYFGDNLAASCNGDYTGIKIDGELKIDL